MGGATIKLEVVQQLPFSAARLRMFDKLVHKMKVGFRSDYDCGSLLWPIGGDPYMRSQRLLVVMLTLLCSLFFNVLFFRTGGKPVCQNLPPNNETF